MERLDPLPKDEYIIAFGPNGRHFFATPQGYYASYLPPEVRNTLLRQPEISRIVWASYGSMIDSWFFAFERNDGTRIYRAGRHAPRVVRGLVQLIESQQSQLQEPLKVQLGHGGSFFASIGAQWTSSDLPHQLMDQLRVLSTPISTAGKLEGHTVGAKYGRIQHVEWSLDGSYWVQLETAYRLNFPNPAALAAWYALWAGTARHNIKDRLKLDLAHVSLNPFANDYFLALKRHYGTGEPTCIFHFGPHCTHSNLPSCSTTNHETKDLQRQAGEGSRWAVVTKNGRPNKNDNRELELRKGNRVRIIREMGRAWYIVEDSNGEVGWAHGLWLGVGDKLLSSKPQARYIEFEQDLQKLISQGRLETLPPWEKYTKKCKDDGCASLDICVHNLQDLLQGSQNYAYDWLKETRNLWHPDRFARFCHPDHAEELKVKAEQIFVLFTMIMERAKPKT